MKSNMTRRILLMTVAGFFITAFAPVKSFGAEPADATRNYIGINVWFLDDWNGNNSFADIIKHARRWRNYDWNADPVLDQDGWPTTDCSTVIFGPGNATGVYKLFFNGSATSVSMMWNQGTVSNLQYNSTTNTSTADVNLTSEPSVGGLRFLGTRRTAASVTNTGITNVRLYRPAYPTNGSQVYTNEWLALMGRFQVIRFMDWLLTNVSPIKTWSQRRRPNTGDPGNINVDGRTGPVGHTLEDFIRLCNDVNADFWLNIPVFADDDYVTKTAQAILYGTDGVNPYTSPQTSPVFPPLNQNLKVYVEYGNEIWNGAGGFYGFPWVKIQSDLVIANTSTPHPIIYDGNPGEWGAMMRWTAWKGAEHGLTFRGVFGDDAMMSRIRPVLMGQLGGGFYPEGLKFLEGFYSTERPSGHAYPNVDPKPVSYYIYGSGGSAYYGVNTWSTDVNTFFATSNYPQESFRRANSTDAAWAGNFGLKRIAYEGGMGLDGGSWGATDEQKRAINADPRMKTLTDAYHDVWSGTGGDLLVYYEASGSINWEFTPSPSITNTPKLLAIDNIRDTMPRAQVELAGIAPCVLNIRDARAAYHSADNGTFWNGTSGGQDVLSGIDPGEWVAAGFGSEDNGYYLVSARAAASSSNISIWLNGVQISTHQLTGNNLMNTPQVSVQLKRGLNVLRYQPVTGESSLHSFTVERDPNPPVNVVTKGPSAAKVSTSLKLFSGSNVINLNIPVLNTAHVDIYTISGRHIVGIAENSLDGISLPALGSGAYILRVTGKNGENWRGTFLIP